MADTRCSEEGFKNRPEDLNRYLLAISLVSPKRLPALEYLILEMVFDEKADEAHTELGRFLKTFKQKVRLNLTAFSNECWFCDPNRLSFIDWIYPFGPWPFELDPQRLMYAELQNCRLVRINGRAMVAPVRPRDDRFAPSLTLVSSITCGDCLKSHADVRFDFKEFSFQIQKNRNVQFNAQQFMLLDSLSIESYLFGDTFQKSPNSKHFGLADFCECTDPKLLYDAPLSGKYVNIFMDFNKLRGLITKAALTDQLRPFVLPWEF